MKKSDWKLFVESGQRTRNVHLDWMEDFTPSAMAEAFKLAADRVVDTLSSDPFHPDRFVYPIVYLYRHYVELQLKLIIVGAYQLAQFKQQKKPAYGHQLAKLWSEAKRLLIAIYADSDHADLQPIEEMILELDAADPDGQGFRYYRNRTGDVNLQQLPRVISLEHVKQKMNIVFNFLHGCELGIDAAFDYECEFGTGDYQGEP